MTRVAALRLYAVIVLCAAGIATPAARAGAQVDLIELVESVPDETVLDQPEIRNTQEVWLDMINGARSRIDMEQFYLSGKPGHALDAVVDAIEQAAARGVAVRIITDQTFRGTYPEIIDRWSGMLNMKLRVVDFTKVAIRAVQHAKFFVVDGEHLFLGSQNFDWRALEHIHEIGVRIRQKAIARDFLRVFEMDWTLAGTGDTAAARSVDTDPATPYPLMLHVVPRNRIDTAHEDPLRALVAVTPTCSPGGFLPRAIQWDGSAIVRLLDSAKRDISAHVMSYSAAGGFEIDHALRRAAARGVQVRLLVADWSLGKKRLPSLRALQALPNVDVRFSSIPLHSSGFISFARVEHCKYMTVDGEQAWIGTANWSSDYFHSSRNVGIVVAGRPIAGTLLKVFETSWNSPYTQELDPAKEYEPPKTNDGSGK